MNEIDRIREELEQKLRKTNKQLCGEVHAFVNTVNPSIAKLMVEQLDALHDPDRVVNMRHIYGLVCASGIGAQDNAHNIESAVSEIFRTVLCARPDLHNVVNFVDCYLGSSISSDIQSNLQSQRFEYSHLVNNVFKRTDFSVSSFSNSTLCNLEFEHCKLDKVIAHMCQIESCEFINSSLVRTNIQGSIIRASKFKECDLQLRANDMTNIIGCVFSKCKIRILIDGYTNFGHITRLFTSSVFEDCEFEYASLYIRDALGCHFENCKHRQTHTKELLDIAYSEDNHRWEVCGEVDLLSPPDQ